MALTPVQQLTTVSDTIKGVAEAAMEAGGGLLRLTPTWVPRSFLQPGTRLKLDPGAVADNGAYRIIVVQGEGRKNRLVLDCPKMVGFHDLTRDEVFCSEATARAGVTFENTSENEPLVILRYFGPDVNPDAPDIGDV